MSRFNKRLNVEANTGIREDRPTDKAIIVEEIAFTEPTEGIKRRKKGKKEKKREEDEGQEHLELHYE